MKARFVVHRLGLIDTKINRWAPMPRKMALEAANLCNADTRNASRYGWVPSDPPEPFN